MKSILRKSRSPRGLFAAAALFAISLLGVGFASHAQADSQRPVNGQRLITVHDQGEEKGFLTQAPTLRKALEGAHIRIDKNDLVEPSLDDELVASNYEVNIYRARPVTIVDGAARKRVMSPYRTARQVVEHADMTLHDEDQAAMTVNSDLVGDGSGVQLSIDRATAFKLKLYGKVITAYTQGATVGDMLKEKGIKLEKSDTLATAESTPITAGMLVEIWRNGKQTFTQDEKIEAPVRQVQNADQPVGYKKVQTEGKPGKKTVTYEIVMKNGKEVSRKVIQSVVLEKPEERVEVIGTKIELPPGSHTDWMAAAGIASSDFGYVDFIISHESSWRPDAASPNGYYGLGQTSLSNISSACPNWQSDPVCQLRFFTGYANGRYGGWAGSYDFWTGHHWW
jgi:resuscitation-promoting factor RpfB